MNTVCAKLMIVIYGISIAGYVLLDGSHEILHVLKSKIHHHDHHSHSHNHHVEDHQDVFTPDDKDSEGKIPVKVFGFLLFYQKPIAYSLLCVSDCLQINGLYKKLLTQAQAPPTRPPLS